MRRPIRRQRRTRASFGGTLVRIDEPELIYLQTPGSAVIIAVALHDGAGEYPFLGAEISDSQWHRYLQGQVDLRYLLLYPKYNRWYQFDLAEFEGGLEVRLDPVAQLDVRYYQYLPEVAFFSRSHTEPVTLMAKPGATQSFEVDGAWDLGDFSKFYGKVSDVYAFFNGMRNWQRKDVDVGLKRRIREAFEHPWRGGSSYVAFFDSLFSAQPFDDRLSVRSIQYASPGHVDVDGSEVVFQQIRETLAHFGHDSAAAKETYNRIYAALSKGGYLKMDCREFKEDAPEALFFLDQAHELATAIGFHQTALVHELSERNSLVTLKIVLALARRTDGLFAFFAEGRAKLPGEDVVYTSNDDVAIVQH